MSLSRLITAVCATACATLLGAGVATACEESGWRGLLTPYLRCLEAGPAGDSKVAIHNACSDDVELTPSDCDAPCSETLLIPPNETETLTLPDPDNAKDGDVRAFDYKMSDQEGTLVYTLDLNICTSDEGDCSVAAVGARSGVHRSCAFFVFSALLVRLLRRRKAGAARVVSREPRAC